MNLIDKKNALNKVKYLLKDIEGELHFRSPHSSKIMKIRDMLEWLEGGKPVGCFKPFYGEEKDKTNIQDV
ncbi:hypothetical protein EKG38_11275 [Shewanella canadensis]|uniref:Uncharacterized protein n=1 Tax=Shewanella canadensis TaxID=271096 RepID=A0A3S0RXQ0_9GAMM|nr:hypothetical protein [Shewanella canadensis]RTR38743.1 hypothetical protein EKG38_11275 [Shewanella canadensis]